MDIIMIPGAPSSSPFSSAAHQQLPSADIRYRGFPSVNSPVAPTTNQIDTIGSGILPDASSLLAPGGAVSGGPQFNGASMPYGSSPLPPTRDLAPPHLPRSNAISALSASGNNQFQLSPPQVPRSVRLWVEGLSKSQTPSPTARGAAGGGGGFSISNSNTCSTNSNNNVSGPFLNSSSNLAGPASSSSSVPQSTSFQLQPQSREQLTSNSSPSATSRTFWEAAYPSSQQQQQHTASPVSMGGLNMPMHSTAGMPLLTPVPTSYFPVQQQVLGQDDFQHQQQQQMQLLQQQQQQQMAYYAQPQPGPIAPSSVLMQPQYQPMPQYYSQGECAMMPMGGTITAHPTQQMFVQAQFAPVSVLMQPQQPQYQAGPQYCSQGGYAMMGTGMGMPMGGAVAAQPVPAQQQQMLFHSQPQQQQALLMGMGMQPVFGQMMQPRAPY